MSTREFAKKLVKEKIITKSYSLWRNDGFRKAINFVRLNNKQQDMILNELEIVVLVDVLFFLEERAKDTNQKDRVLYANISEYLISCFLEVMDDTNISGRQMSLWQKLINLRISEYRKEMKYVMNKSRKWEVFEGQDKFLKPTWGRIAALSLWAMSRVDNRKKTSARNKTWKQLRHFFISFEVDLVDFFKTEDLKDVKVLN